ncbi:MFS transporter [Streptomyces sp. NBRC 14336]|uniref:MFS transporter n=1 Tax=Streptomyces sp. NBRC 14336 TaxID=3030992 RepID=UPI0024A34A7E|nr:MFS transporter [Streptomyces sp. NBRC 14336]GLW48601.1 MFS transporter [Streptomyces sp. NBRC 14336]
MNPRPTLVASVAGAVVVALDGTVLTLAQPALQRELGASHAQVQWTSTGYLVAVASLLVFGGRLGDRYGHHRLFALGMLGFGLTSAGIALSSGIGTVIGLRVAQGVCGALLQPATLGMLRAAYPPDRLRTPIAVRTAAIGVAAAAGPLVGGALVAGPGWRSVFLLNVLPALVCGLWALTARAPRPTAPVPLDLPGALLLAAALATLVHALVALPDRAPVLLLTAVTAALFLRHERRTPNPLLPPAVIGAPPVRAGLGTLTAASAALSGTLFAATFLLQDTLGLGPWRTALCCLPLAVLMVAAAPCCAVLLRRAGARRTTVTALAVLAAGVWLLSRASGPLGLGAGFGLLGAGFGTVMVAATHVVVREAPVASAGVAGGLQQTAMNLGPVLGVALATALMGADGDARLPLAVLPVLAVAGMAAGAALPGRDPAATGETGTDPRNRTRVPERR